MRGQRAETSESEMGRWGSGLPRLAVAFQRKGLREFVLLGQKVAHTETADLDEGFISWRRNFKRFDSSIAAQAMCFRRA